jgi:xylose isomerase
MIEDGALSTPLTERYAGWEDQSAAQMLDGTLGLDDIAALVLRNDLNPTPRSGRQEKLENIVNRYV